MDTACKLAEVHHGVFVRPCVLQLCRQKAVAVLATLSQEGVRNLGHASAPHHEPNRCLDEDASVGVRIALDTWVDIEVQLAVCLVPRAVKATKETLEQERCAHEKDSHGQRLAL
eukprot:COSAG02_NODE_8466_length_2563_cov_1.844156_1_plen_114_part_00